MTNLEKYQSVFLNRDRNLSFSGLIFDDVYFLYDYRQWVCFNLGISKLEHHRLLFLINLWEYDKIGSIINYKKLWDSWELFEKILKNGK